MLPEDAKLQKNWTAKELGLTMRGVVLPVGLELDSVDVAASALEVGSDPFALGAQGSSVTVRVSAGSIERMLSGLSLQSLTQVSVTTEGPLLRVSAVVRVLVSVPAVALCSLVVEEGKRLSAVLESVEPAGGRAIVERQLAQVNPLLDLSSLPFSISSVVVADGWVVIEGQIEPR